jgi:hypothetical protein
MGAGLEIICVDPALVHRVWPLCSHLIRAAMQRGGLGAYEPVEEAVHAGRALLWLATDGQTIHAAAVTQLAQTEWRKVCEIIACGATPSPRLRGEGGVRGGNEREGRARWLHLIETIEDFARAEGCSAMRIVGRKGWARVLSRGGFETRPYRVKHIVLEKELG